MAIPLPKWMDEEYLTDKEKKKERTKFLLRIAALYATENGGLRDLALALGYRKPTQLSSLLYETGQVSPELAIAIEELVGRSLIPREQLRPDLFLIRN